MDAVIIYFFYFACILLAGWIIMLIAGALGAAISFGTGVLIAAGLTVIKLLV